MAGRKSNKLIEFLLSREGETNDEVREYLLEVGIDPDEAVKSALKAIKKRRAERKKAEGRSLVERFNEAIQQTKDDIKKEFTEENSRIEGAFAFKGMKKTNDENIKMLEEDNRKLEILKKVRDDNRGKS